MINVEQNLQLQWFYTCNIINVQVNWDSISMKYVGI